MSCIIKALKGFVEIFWGLKLERILNHSVLKLDISLHLLSLNYIFRRNLFYKMFSLFYIILEKLLNFIYQSSSENITIPI